MAWKYLEARLLSFELLADAPKFHKCECARGAKHTAEKNHYHIVHWARSLACAASQLQPDGNHVITKELPTHHIYLS